MKNYLTEFLRENNSENVCIREVSKVSEQPFDTFNTALFSVCAENIESNNATGQSESLTVVLNKIILSGASFVVSTDNFKAVNISQCATDFLNSNREEILCTLQQAVLRRNLFSRDNDAFEDFAFEIDEREAIMSESADDNSTLIRNEAIKDVTRKWFGEILKSR